MKHIAVRAPLLFLLISLITPRLTLASDQLICLNLFSNELEKNISRSELNDLGPEYRLIQQKYQGYIMSKAVTAVERGESFVVIGRISGRHSVTRELQSFRKLKSSDEAIAFAEAHDLRYKILLDEGEDVTDRVLIVLKGSPEFDGLKEQATLQQSEAFQNSLLKQALSFSKDGSTSLTIWKSTIRSGNLVLFLDQVIKFANENNLAYKRLHHATYGDGIELDLKGSKQFRSLQVQAQSEVQTQYRKDILAQATLAAQAGRSSFIIGKMSGRHAVTRNLQKSRHLINSSEEAIEFAKNHNLKYTRLADDADLTDRIEISLEGSSEFEAISQASFLRLQAGILNKIAEKAMHAKASGNKFLSISNFIDVRSRLWQFNDGGVPVPSRKDIEPVATAIIFAQQNQLVYKVIDTVPISSAPGAHPESTPVKTVVIELQNGEPKGR